MTRLLARIPLIALAALLALAIAPAAALASGKDVIRDCTDDELLSKSYTQREYKDALAQLSADSDQYGNCRSVIKRAQLQALRDAQGANGGGGSNAGAGQHTGASGGSGTSGGSGGSGAGRGFGNPPATKQLSSATPDERAAVDVGRRAPVAAVDVRGAAVKPGIGSASDLPAPLLILLALVLAGALALAATRIRALVLTRRA